MQNLAEWLTEDVALQMDRRSEAVGNSAAQ